MKPKYEKGAKVRIKASDFMGKILDPRIRQFENMSGEIIESTSIVAFVGGLRSDPQSSSERVTVYQYTVKIDDQIILHDILEDCLENAMS